MKYVAFRLAVAVVTLVLGIASVRVFDAFGFGAASQSGAEQEILQLEREYIRANLSGDTATLDTILADDFSIRGRWGRVTSKAERLSLLESPDFAFEAIDTDDVRVEVNGDSAKVTGKAFIRSRYQGEERVSLTYRFTRSYEKRQGRWQIVSVRVWR